MAYDAKVLEVMIASPGDVDAERQIVREVIADWNALYSRTQNVVMMPIGWETHSSPDLSGRPQQLINDRILSHTDLLIGIFWTKIGTPTGTAASGTVEEIEGHLAAGKPVMLYFSNAPVRPDSVQPEQYEKLKKFKNWAYPKGLVQTYGDKDEFRELLRRQLPLTLRDNAYTKSILPQGATEALSVAVETPGSSSTGAELSAEAKALLAAAAASDGMILRRRPLSGVKITAGGRQMNDANHRSGAIWAEAVDELVAAGLVRDVNGFSEIFEITALGYKVAGPSVETDAVQVAAGTAT
ncbi:DUF4062 domain-containing protein [Methylobacterium oxalidis]|uniref:DUF4062 domain-containing protein n=1 Tax=Methylobacterium oxalidis TaxID=944322 RepID=A0A512JCA3_9HYPH|nr:DUF4062 domain-containing protein [Methylobacterium oxalidis]GEP07604.1 hypothetical protein MOX02_56420 [Methylobacterium oxalidis]GLS66189.1 hypothetical protein GCM10007888_45710 [Methylobacterium oxalidis]